MQWFTPRRELGLGDQRARRVAGFLLAGGHGRRARALLLTCLIAALALVNVLGIRQSAAFVNTLTIGKLVPLLVFIAVGIFSIDVVQAMPNSALASCRSCRHGAAAGVCVRRIRGGPGCRR